MNLKYLYFWIFFIVVRALVCGYRNHQEHKEVGYNQVWFEETGQKIMYDGSLKGVVSGTLASALGLIFSPVFLLIETIKFIPAAFVLYLIS